MSSKQYVVWEWENKQRRWRPYSPEVCQLLERAYTKNLKFANLGDADPDLDEYLIDMKTMQLMFKDTNKVSSKIQRSLYDSDSPAANGAQWQWNGDNPIDWHIYDMSVQCVLEKYWSQGFRKIDMNHYINGCPYLIDFCNMTQININSKKLRSIRRLSHASYPVCLSNTSINNNNNNNLNLCQPSTSQQGAISKFSKPDQPPDKYSKRRGSKGEDQEGKKGDHVGRKSLLSKNYELRTRRDHSKYQHLRNDSLDSKMDQQLGQHSDCGSSMNGRRPSLDTVSTYLSQDEDILADHHNFNTSSYLLSRLTSDSDMEDDTFCDVDDEVQQTLAGQIDTLSTKHSSINSKPSTSRESHFIPISGAPKTTSHNRFNYMNIQRKPPANNNEKMLHQNSRVVQNPPNDDCSICYYSLREPTEFGDSKNDTDSILCVALTLCNHEFHEICLKKMLSSKTDSKFIQCPVCKVIHGNKTGNQPNGRMTHRTTRTSLPGYKECGTIEITYSFSSGIQGPDHPNPGRHYSAFAFPRIAYLPDNEMGRKVLKLLQEAWSRRLIFTVGRSVTSGIEDCITWNDIHHKTQFSGSYGYPDPHYLTNTISELASHGITDSTDV